MLQNDLIVDFYLYFKELNEIIALTFKEKQQILYIVPFFQSLKNNRTTDWQAHLQLGLFCSHFISSLFLQFFF